MSSPPFPPAIRDWVMVATGDERVWRLWLRDLPLSEMAGWVPDVLGQAKMGRDPSNLAPGRGMTYNEFRAAAI